MCLRFNHNKQYKSILAFSVMPEEIEKKFLLMEDGHDHYTSQLKTVYTSLEDLEFDVLSRGKKIKQGYLSLDMGVVLASNLGININFGLKEARLRDLAGIFYFTLKGDGNLVRGEKEMEIAENVFNEFWDLTNGRRVEKFRLAKHYQGHTLELDVYQDRKLIVAEIKVPSIEIAYSLIPLGKDVTEDPKYKNKNLAK